MAANRLAQVSGHITNNASKGLLAGEVAIITGSGQGIGRSAALLYAKEGAKVVVSDLDGNKAQVVVDEIKGAGGEAVAIAGDVTAVDFPKKVVEGTIKAFGKINHLVLNAGFTADKMLHGMSDDNFNVILNCHVTAPFRLVREAAPYFRLKGKDAHASNRSIIFISSIAGLHGNVGQANYAAAKSAVTGLTKTIAKEWGPFGVRVNCAAFGYIKTRLTGAKEAGEHIVVGGQKIALGIPGAGKAPEGPVPGIPLGRPGEPDEAASGLLFLSSPMASFISGHTLEITGGQGI